MKTFTYRLYPNRYQRRSLDSVLETCRHFYNECLAERRDTYWQTGASVSLKDQLRKVKVLKATSPHAVDIHSHVLQVVVADLDKAFQAFFRRCKTGEKPGFPRFKARDRFRSFGLKELGNGFKIDGRRLRLSGIGRVAVRWHRPIEGTIKTVRLVRKAGKWYACFSCEVAAAPLPPTSTEVGIDAGLSSLFTLSTGEHIENPRWYRGAQRKLRVLQRRVARKKLGGRNRRKAISDLARYSERVANQRKDYLNKLVCRLVATFGAIAIEDLSIRNMVHGNMAKSILDAGWGFFKQRLLSKAANAGRVVVLVNPAYTSQDCCQCGHRQKLTLADRWYTCACSNSRDRDENAAHNVLTAGRVVWDTSSSTEGLSQEAVPL